MPLEDLEEVIFRLKVKQLPDINKLTELEFIYYSVGFFYFSDQKDKSTYELIQTSFKELSNMFEFFSYETADIKTLLYDITSSTRGIGGCKQTFNIENLPSFKKEKKKRLEQMKESTETETYEQKLERHRKFFEELKQSFTQ